MPGSAIFGRGHPALHALCHGLIGTFVLAIIPVLVHATGLFDIRARAMSCGVGSMLAACTGGLVTAEPDN